MRLPESAALRLLMAWFSLALPLHAGPARDAGDYAGAIARINDAHVRQPAKNTESQLARQLPAAARSALQRVLQAKPGPELAPALQRCAEAALDLDLMEDFQAARTRLTEVDAASAVRLGNAVSRPRFIVRGIGGFQAGWLEGFAEVCDGVLTAYDEVFGFAEFSKVPGKKLRVRVHLEPQIKNPPHFAPQFPWHSEVDFPVADAAQFASPTPEGQFLFYGLCHELGHVIAMWGNLKTMEDHHAWAHYTGVAVVEHLASTAQDQPWMQRLKDVKWRSLKLERELPDNRTLPSLLNKNGVMALLLALHDAVGPRMIGQALNGMDKKGSTLRINHVRYYSFADFQKALIAAVPEKKEAITALFRKP